MKKSILQTAILVAALLFAQLILIAQNAVEITDSTHYIILFAPNATPTEIDELKTELSATEQAILPVTQVRLWHVPANVVQSMGGPIGVRNHGVGKTYVIATDPNYNTENPGSSEGSGSGSGFPGCPGTELTCPFGAYPVTISIHDTGYDGAPVNPANHTLFQTKMWKNLPETGPGFKNRSDEDSNAYTDDAYGWDFTLETPDPLDMNDHGTHVTGIPAQILNINAATSVSLMPLQALDQTGNGLLWDLIESVDYALAKQVRVMNMSIAYLGVPSTSPGVLESMFDFAKTYIPGGTLFVVAAGNDGIDLDTVSGAYRYYPAQFASDNMIVVGAEDCGGNMPAFSNRGVNTVDITAPGVDIFSTVTNNLYALMSGTSMSAPFVATAAARYGSFMPVFDWDVVKTAVLNNAVTLPSLIGKVYQGKSLRFCGPPPSLLPKNQGGVVQAPMADEMRISPNPASGSFVVELDDIQLVTGKITITNAIGQTVQQSVIPAGENVVQIHCTAWLPGMYQVQVQAGEISLTKMLVKS